MKLSATHAFNCIVLMVKFGWTSCENIPPACDIIRLARSKRYIETPMCKQGLPPYSCFTSFTCRHAWNLRYPNHHATLKHWKLTCCSQKICLKSSSTTLCWSTIFWISLDNSLSTGIKSFNSSCIFSQSHLNCLLLFLMALRKDVRCAILWGVLKNQVFIWRHIILLCEILDVNAWSVLQ